MFRTVILSMGLSMSLFGQIHEIDSITEVPAYIESVDTSLCIFDIDYTLIMPKNPSGHLPNIIKHMDHYKKVYSDLTAEEVNTVRMNLVGEGNSVIIEENSPTLIKDLMDQGVYVMGFTAGLRYHGTNGDWRGDDLKSVGFDFESTCDQIAPASESFHRGVLYGNFEKLKGPKLRTFLQEAHIKPSVVVMVDDKLVHLMSVEKELSDLGISFIGLKYKGARNYKCDEVSFEELQDHFYKLRWFTGK